MRSSGGAKLLLVRACPGPSSSDLAYEGGYVIYGINSASNNIKHTHVNVNASVRTVVTADPL